jgi:hypothetical protein
MINADRELSLTLTAGDLNVVFNALSEAPYRVVAPIIEKLRQQVVAVDPTAFDQPAPERPARNGEDNSIHNP